jgi:hypothetical protein
VWESTVNGRELHFHLAGINNQNFIMRDEETGSWWQQVTGEAILGPLKGQRLRPVFHDELTFATWKQEQPLGRVLRPDEAMAKAGNYVPADWEQRMVKVPVATSATPDRTFEPRNLIAGIRVNGAAKAYPVTSLQKQSPVIDKVGGVPIMIVVANDGRSIRAFERTIEGQAFEFFAKDAASGSVLVDATTGSEWDFTGWAVSGPLTGKRLKRLDVLEDYWFDWHGYNPDTSVYSLGEQ